MSSLDEKDEEEMVGLMSREERDPPKGDADLGGGGETMGSCSLRIASARELEEEGGGGGGGGGLGS